MSEQDKKVQALIALVNEKKSKIKAAERPTYKTNLQFSYSPDTAQRTNLQIVNDVAQLLTILSFLTCLKNEFDKLAKDAKLTTQFTWMGYTYLEWQLDIMTRINKTQLAQTKKELETLEGRLDKLISPELRTRLELAEIEKLLEQ